MPGRAIHLHLHTLYGGQPHPHMFLGQMIGALERGAEFHMTSGEQLREYHHAHDIAGAMLAGRDWESAREPVHLSSGAPVRLADLARAVFAGSGHRVAQVGAPPTAAVISRPRVHTFRRSAAVLPRTDRRRVRVCPRAPRGGEGGRVMAARGDFGLHSGL